MVDAVKMLFNLSFSAFFSWCSESLGRCRSGLAMQEVVSAVLCHSVNAPCRVENSVTIRARDDMENEAYIFVQVGGTQGFSRV